MWIGGRQEKTSGQSVVYFLIRQVNVYRGVKWVHDVIAVPWTNDVIEAADTMVNK